MTFCSVLKVRSSNVSVGASARPSRSALPSRSELASSSGWRAAFVTKKTSSARSPTVKIFAFCSATRSWSKILAIWNSRPGRSPATSSTIVRAFLPSGEIVICTGVENMRTCRGARRVTLSACSLPAVSALSSRCLISSSRRRSVIVLPSLSSTQYVSRLDFASGTMRASTIVRPSSSSTAVARTNERVSSGEYTATAVKPGTTTSLTSTVIAPGLALSASTRVCHAISSGRWRRKYSSVNPLQIAW